MTEAQRIPPQPIDAPESPAETTPIAGPDRQALEMIERAAMEMAGRRPPKRAADEPVATFSTFADDDPVLTTKPANDPAPRVETKAPEDIIPSAETISADPVEPIGLTEPIERIEAIAPIELPAPVDQIEPAPEIMLDEQLDPAALLQPEAPITPAPVELAKPVAEIKLVEQFDPAPILRPEAPLAPAPAKIAPPAVRPMFDDHFRLALSGWQSAGVTVAIFAFVIAAFGMAASGWATAHDWTCRVGLATTYCPAPPATKPLAPPEIPT